MDLTSLISVWEMDEASGNAVDAYGSETLTANSAPGATTGKINGARTFNNTNYFSRADDAALSTGDIDFMFTCWVLANSFTDYDAILGKFYAGNDEYILYYLASRFRWDVQSSSTTTTVTANNFGAPSTATWYFVVVYHDSVNNLIGIQVNNGTANTAAHSTGCRDGTNNFGLGARGNGGNLWDGAIDQTTMWKRLLTADEKTALYNGGSGLAYPFTTTATRGHIIGGGMGQLLGAA